jgi:hypothetical protein
MFEKCFGVLDGDSKQFYSYKKKKEKWSMFGRLVGVSQFWIANNF